MLQKLKYNQQPDLSIVIPAYREERRIGSTLDDLAKVLKEDTFFKERHIEVIVVVADAPDGTREIVAKKRKLFKQFAMLEPGPRVGKGRDVQFGMLRAQGKYVVFMDADLATPLHHVQEFCDICSGGSDIVIGTRNLFGYRDSRARDLFSGIGNVLYQAVSGMHIEDTQCGFKMFTQKAAELCFSKLTIMGWGFDVELLAIAEANHLSVTPIRINDWQDKPYSTYTENVFQITMRMLTDFIKVTIRQRTGWYSKEPRA